MAAAVWLDELASFVRIPSVSADSAHQADVLAAGEWVRDFVRDSGGEAEIVDWLAEDARGADAGIIFDSGMIRRDVPAFNVAVRGLAYFHLRVRTGERDLHSGVYGGAALNALHVLVQTLSGALARDGRLPE